MEEVSGLVEGGVGHCCGCDDRNAAGVQVLLIEGIEAKLRWRGPKRREYFYYRCGSAVYTASRHDLGIDVESAAVHVQEGFLVLDQPVSYLDVLRSGVCRRDARRDCVRVGATSGNYLSVHPEQTPIGVQQVLLVGDQLITGLDVAHCLRRSPRRHRNHECRNHQGQNNTNRERPAPHCPMHHSDNTYYRTLPMPPPGPSNSGLARGEVGNVLGGIGQLDLDAVHVGAVDFDDCGLFYAAYQALATVPADEGALVESAPVYVDDE